MSDRLDVRKTFKLYINGAFPRSESGRSYDVVGADGGFLANAAMASRKDTRDAVVAARSGLSAWTKASAYNRGQVLYRIAEMVESRRLEFAAAVAAAEGVTPSKANRIVDAAVDRIVWYAGWTDKIAQVFGGTNPVAGPFFNFSIPSATGVIGVIAPQASSLLGLVSTVAPVLATANSAVVVASEQRPLCAVLLAECCATADVPAGVVNILTGITSELAPVLASHADVDGIDLSGAGEQRAAWAALATTSIKRVGISLDDEDFTSDPGTTRLRRFIETTTVWHTVGQ